MMKSIIFIFLALLLLVACEPDENPVTPTPNEELRIDSLAKYEIFAGGIVQIYLNKVITDSTFQVFLGAEKLSITKNDTLKNKSLLSVLTTDSSSSNFIKLVYDGKEIQSVKPVEILNLSKLKFTFEKDLYYSCSNINIKGTKLSNLNGLIKAYIDTSETQILSFTDSMLTISDNGKPKKVEGDKISIYLKDSLLYSSIIYNTPNIVWNLAVGYITGSNLSLTWDSFPFYKFNQQNFELYIGNTKIPISKFDSSANGSLTKFQITAKVPKFSKSYVTLKYNGCEIGKSSSEIENILDISQLNYSFENDIYFACSEIKIKGTNLSSLDGLIKAYIGTEETQILSVTDNIIKIADNGKANKIGEQVMIYLKDSLIHTAKIFKNPNYVWDLSPGYFSGSSVVLKFSFDGYFKNEFFEIFIGDKKVQIVNTSVFYNGGINHNMEILLPEFSKGYLTVLYNGCEIGRSKAEIENLDNILNISDFELETKLSAEYYKFFENESIGLGKKDTTITIDDKQYSIVNKASDMKNRNIDYAYSTQAANTLLMRGFDYVVNYDTKNAKSEEKRRDTLKINFDKLSKTITGEVSTYLGSASSWDKSSSSSSSYFNSIIFNNLELKSEDNEFFYYELTHTKELQKLKFTINLSNFSHTYSVGNRQFSEEYSTKFLPQEGDYFKLKLKKR